MATTTTVSAWGKAGAWALDSEEHEEELMNQTNQQEEEEKKKTNKYSLVHNQSQPLSDFPSLSSAAAVTKTKKKKPQAVPLSEFTTGKSVSYGSAAKPKGLTPDELSLLPTGPRERSAEELDRSSSSRLGGGFRSYGSSSSDNNNNNRDDSRWGSNRDDPRRTIREPAPPSRADEIDDWGAAKKSSSSSDNRRERASPGFFDSQSRADESDSWLSKKSFVPSSSSSDHPRRMGMGMGGGVGGGGFERDRRGGGFDKEISGAGADSDNWGKKRPQDTGPNNSDNGARPKLVLQPRSLPATNGEQQQPGSASVTTTKSNPFGAARPREQVLAEKGQDWKKIDEQLESIKFKDVTSAANDAFGKKTFGNGNGRLSSPEARTERSWRKTTSVDSPTPSEEKADKEDDGGVRDEN